MCSLIVFFPIVEKAVAVFCCGSNGSNGSNSSISMDVDLERSRLALSEVGTEQKAKARLDFF